MAEVQVSCNVLLCIINIPLPVGDDLPMKDIENKSGSLKPPGRIENSWEGRRVEEAGTPPGVEFGRKAGGGIQAAHRARPLLKLRGRDGHSHGVETGE